MFVKTFVAVTLLHILSASCEEKKITFPIAKDLNDTKPSETSDKAIVTITGLCSEEENGTINIKINLIEHFNEKLKNVCVFFANEKQEVLQIVLKEKVFGTKYVTPYKVSEDFEGDEGKKDTEGSFPKSWLPSNSSRISAALEIEDKIYCTYGLRNYEMGIPDLMVVQEYNKIVCK